jgi:hypothetical protein
VKLPTKSHAVLKPPGNVQDQAEPRLPAKDISTSMSLATVVVRGLATAEQLSPNKQVAAETFSLAVSTGVLATFVQMLIP